MSSDTMISAKMRAYHAYMRDEGVRLLGLIMMDERVVLVAYQNDNWVPYACNDNQLEK